MAKRSLATATMRSDKALHPHCLFVCVRPAFLLLHDDRILILSPSVILCAIVRNSRRATAHLGIRVDYSALLPLGEELQSLSRAHPPLSVFHMPQFL